MSETLTCGEKLYNYDVDKVMHLLSLHTGICCKVSGEFYVTNTVKKAITMKQHFIFLLLAGTLFWGCTAHEKLTPEEAKQIAKEAYIYGFPMVMNYKTLYAYSLDKYSTEYKGNFNQMACNARLYTPEDKTIVTPNSDTPYCMYWCDIRQQPIVIVVPEMEADRYYSFQLIDLYTHNFAYIGSLSSGSKAGKYLVVPTNWKGEKPEGITDIIRCETNLFFTIVRTQLKGAGDLASVKDIQGRYQVLTMNEFLGEGKTPVAENDGFPEWKEGDQFTPASFVYLDAMLQLVNPAEEEKPLMKEFARLGLGTAEGFDLNRFDQETQDSITAGVKEGKAEIESFIAKCVADPLASAKLFGTRKFLEQSARNNYGLDNMFLLRAAGAHIGLYGNSGEEALYPTYMTDEEKKPLDAANNKYTITFKANELPPVKAFWSLTLYDGKTQLLINNPINRYLVNSSMMKDFVLGDDGSLTIYVQKDAPGGALKANWLPAPEGPFYCVMRLYGPEDNALNGSWRNPPMQKSK